MNTYTRRTYCADLVTRLQCASRREPVGNSPRLWYFTCTFNTVSHFVDVSGRVCLAEHVAANNVSIRTEGHTIYSIALSSLKVNSRQWLLYPKDRGQVRKEVASELANEYFAGVCGREYEGWGFWIVQNREPPGFVCVWVSFSTV